MWVEPAYEDPAVAKEFIVQLPYNVPFGGGLKAHAGEMKVETPPGGRTGKVDERNPEKFGVVNK
jgi:hypothetical protein